MQKRDATYSNVSEYFTDDVNQAIDAMSDKQMEGILREMIDSIQWTAMLKYVDLRSRVTESTLRGTNPHENPHAISFAQGALAGLSDLVTYVISLNAKSEE